MTKIYAKTAVPLDLVICFGMSVFWLIGRALADELDRILGVASFASMSSLALTFLVAITVAIDAMDKKSTHASGSRHRRSHRHARQEGGNRSGSPRLAGQLSDVETN